MFFLLVTGIFDILCRLWHIKWFQAPPAPPLPPIPTHLKSSQLKLLNGNSGSSPTSSSFSNGIHKRTPTTVTSASNSAQDSGRHEAADPKSIPSGTVSRFPYGCFLQHLCCVSPSHKKSIIVEDTSLTPKIREHYGLLYQTITDSEIRSAFFSMERKSPKL